jgi:hypothetical protein
MAVLLMRVEAMIASTFSFMPFQNRVGETVIGLRVPYDDGLKILLTEATRKYKHLAVDPSRNVFQAGGYLHPNRCWFIERTIWSKVRAELVAAGVTEFREIPRPADVEHHEPAVAVHQIAPTTGSLVECVMGSPLGEDHEGRLETGFVVMGPGGTRFFACRSSCVRAYLDEIEDRA